MDRKRSCFSCWIPRNGLSCDLRWPMDVLLVCANQKENTIKYRNFLHGTAAVAKWGQEGVWTSRPIAFMVPIHSLNRPILSTPRSRRRALFRSVGKTHPTKARLPKVGPKGLESCSLVQPSTAIYSLGSTAPFPTTKCLHVSRGLWRPPLGWQSTHCCTLAKNY
jgi:hypothetical protein